MATPNPRRSRRALPIARDLATQLIVFVSLLSSRRSTELVRARGETFAPRNVSVSVGSRLSTPFPLRKRKKIFNATTISFIDDAERPPFLREER